MSGLAKLAILASTYPTATQLTILTVTAAQERAHELQQRSNAVVQQWVAAHGPRLQGLLAALDWPPLVEMLPLCAQCVVTLPPDADSAQLRRSYLHTIRKIHPDKLPPESKLRERTAASAIFEALRKAHSA